jgi:hypothetical protein
MPWGSAPPVRTAPVVGTLCGCGWACPRRYARDVQTGDDAVDSSLALLTASRSPHLAPLVSADFRASQAHFVALNWALLGVVAAAKKIGLKKPVVLRLQGTNVKEAKAFIESSGYK